MATQQPRTNDSARQSGALVLILSILLAVVVLIAAVGGTWLYMSGQNGNAEGARTQSFAPPTFVKVKPLTVNLRDSQGQVLYIGISLKVANDDEATRVKTHMPGIRNRILMTLTNKKADDLMTSQGKQALADDILATVQQPFNENEEPLAVEGVLFTDFIVQ